MADLKASSQALTQLLGSRATLLDRTVVFSKIASAIGIAVIAIATSANWPAVVYVAAAVVFVLTVFSVFAEKDASTTLSNARLAMDRAIDQQAESESQRRTAEEVEDAYTEELERLSHFQAARDLVRAIFEDVATSQSTLDEIKVIDRILQQARRSLSLAHGFTMNDFYTICVYERVQVGGAAAELECKSHLRAIDCDLSKARKWKEGVGVAGTALARNEEIIVPDLQAPALGSLYNLPEKKADDDVRYRSIVAEPISLDGKGQLWGVLVATSSNAGHFSLEDRSYVDITQSLAGMISLAVKLVRSKTAATKAGSHP
jgi:hypothetical protein